MQESKLKSFVLVLTVAVAIPGNLVLGQITTGVITGVVKDQTGAVIPGATVSVIDQARSLSRTTVTDHEGLYAFPALPPSTYTIRAQLAGFREEVVRGVILRVNEKITVDLTLTVGEISDRVEVQAEILKTNTQEASLSQVIDERRVVDLPLNGRNFIALAALSAGVAPQQTLRFTQFGIRNQEVSIGGGRYSSTNYLIDGVQAKSLRFNFSSIQPSIDAIQEFKVERNAFSAEFGGGVAVITAVTKSGTNEFHGTLYAFTRNKNLDARNFFNDVKPSFDQNQFGISAGGPVIKDKLFFFGNYEGLRTQKGVTVLARLPDRQSLSGDFSTFPRQIIDPLTGQPFPNNVIPLGRIDSFARKYNDQIPVPNRAGTLNYALNDTFVSDYDQFNIRVDNQMSEKDRLFGRFSFSNWDQFRPGFPSAASFGINLPQNARNFTLQETHVFSPTLLNEFKLGYNRSYHFILPANPSGKNWVQEFGLRNLTGGVNPFNFGRPLVSIAGFNSVGENTFSQGSIENFYSLTNNLTKIWGKHTVKFGYEIMHRRFQHLSDIPPRGTFTFTGFATGNAIADYLLGMPFQAQGAVGDSRANYRSNFHSIYIQDDYKVTSKLTLNLGLRYENQSPWVDQEFGEAVFAPDLGLIVYPKIPDRIPRALEGLFLAEPGVRRGIYDHDWNDWAPRIGLAWRPLGKDDTVIRMGYGIFYDNVNGNEFQFKKLIPPFYGINTLISDSRRPTLFMRDMFPSLDELERLPAPFSIIRTNRTPYSQQWNLNVQRKIAQNLLVEVGYSGSLSVKLWKRFNMNQAELDPTGTIPLRDRLPFPRFDPGILTSANDNLANYHAGHIRVEKGFSQGFSFLATYTFSRAIDLNSGEIQVNDTARRWDKRADRGLSNFHQKNRFALSYIWEIPIGPGRRYLSGSRGFVGKLLEGWQVNGITVFAGGFPFPVTSAAVHGTGSFIPQRANRIADGNLPASKQTPDRFFDTSAFFPAAPGTQGNAGRNILIGPGLNNFDISLFKNNKITEHVNLQFRAEFFNAFNHPNFGLPINDASSAAFGRISDALDGRNIQLALKLIW